MPLQPSSTLSPQDHALATLLKADWSEGVALAVSSLLEPDPIRRMPLVYAQALLGREGLTSSELLPEQASSVLNDGIEVLQTKAGELRASNQNQQAVQLLEVALWRALQSGAAPTAALLSELEQAYEAAGRLDKCVVLLEAQLEKVCDPKVCAFSPEQRGFGASKCHSASGGVLSYRHDVRRPPTIRALCSRPSLGTRAAGDKRRR